MSTGTDYFSVLPVEIISAIIYFQDYKDREKCCLLSKRLYDIYKSTRTQFRLDLAGSRPFGVRKISFVDRDKLDVTLRVWWRDVNEARLEACFRDFRICELDLIPYSPSTSNGFPFRFIRNMTVRSIDLDLNCFKALPTLAPNLEYLTITCFQKWFYTGTEPLTNLKTLKVIGKLPAISSIVKQMPSLTGLIAYVKFPETSPIFSMAPLNLEYMELWMDVLGPISASNALTQLHVKIMKEVIRIEHPQPAPLSHVEIFGFSGFQINLYSALQYYGIGDNLKTICLQVVATVSHFLDEVLDTDQVWNRCPNLENLLTYGERIHVKKLVHIASICTKLRLVSFGSFLEDGEFTTRSLPMTGIKRIFLSEQLPNEELQFLLDRGIDVVYNSEMFALNRWPMRRYPSLW